MKKVFVALIVTVMTLSAGITSVEAKRLGGGGSFGKQSSGASRQAQSPMQQNQAAAAKPAAPAAAPGAAAAKPASAWKGMLGGALLGLGLGAMLSHFGLGGAMASMISTILMVALLGFAAMFIYRMFRRKSADNAARPAYAGAQDAGQPDAYMLKPLTASKIAERIERLLEKQNALLPINEKLKRKDVAGAISECDNVLKNSPKWIVDVFKTKGNLLLELRRVDEARAVYAQALELRDDLVWAKVGLARCNIIAGQLDEAREIIQGVLLKNTQYIEAYDLLAQIEEAQGNENEALDALSRSSEIIPSARRSRLVGDAAYRIGNLEQAKEAFDKVISHTKGSLTAQPTDLLSLAQVHVDTGDAEEALKLLSNAPKRYADSKLFLSTQSAVAAQAHVKLGNLDAAAAAFAVAAQHNAGEAGSELTSLALAKAAFAVGQDDEGARLIAQAVKSDHENKTLITLARKVLTESGKEAMADELIDGAVKQCMSIITEANALMRSAKPDESLAKLEEALHSMPENTGVLLAAAQLHLLWMSQRGINLDYVKRVNRYLTTLDRLIPGNDRVGKMHRFLRETLAKAAAKKA